MKKNLFKTIAISFLGVLSMFSLASCNESKDSSNTSQELTPIVFAKRLGLAKLEAQNETEPVETNYSLVPKDRQRATISIILISILAIGSVTSIIAYVFINKHSSGEK